MRVPIAMRVAAVLVFVLVVSLQLVRNALVAQYATTDVSVAERLWAEHPLVQTSHAMRDMAQASIEGQSVDQRTLALVDEVAANVPLYSEPFLIKGAIALRSGEGDQAERLLTQARTRSPRSAAARYLLASHYIADGRVLDGLREAAVLGRLVPGSTAELAPAVAQYVESAGTSKPLIDLLKANPDLSSRLLEEMAGNAHNSDLVLRMGAALPKTTSEGAPAWQARLVQTFVQQGEYDRARTVWLRFASDQQRDSLVYDSSFRGSSAPPPFNWVLARRGAVVEMQQAKLQILYFGRENMTLASQLLVLAPGAYEIGMIVSGEASEPDEISWTITCLPSRSVVLELPFSAKKGRSLAGRFSIASDRCAAQRLELIGRGGEFPKTSSFSIGELVLKRIGS